MKQQYQSFQLLFLLFLSSSWLIKIIRAADLLWLQMFRMIYDIDLVFIDVVDVDVVSDDFDGF